MPLYAIRKAQEIDQAREAALADVLYTRPAVCIKKSVTMHTPGCVQILTLTLNLTVT